MGRRKINLSRVFAGELVGLREVDDQVWLVSFLDFDLGFFDQDEGRVEPAQNPFGPEKVLTMSPEWTEFKWHAGRDSNPRPSGSKPDTRSRKNRYLRDRERE